MPVQYVHAQELFAVAHVHVPEIGLVAVEEARIAVEYAYSVVCRIKAAQQEPFVCLILVEDLHQPLKIGPDPAGQMSLFGRDRGEEGETSDVGDHLGAFDPEFCRQLSGHGESGEILLVAGSGAAAYQSVFGAQYDETRAETGSFSQESCDPAGQCIAACQFSAGHHRRTVLYFL